MSEIFEFAVIHEPEPEEDGKKPPKPTLIVDVTRILAGSRQEAELHAARAIPEEYADKLEEVTVVVRPF